MRLIVIGASAGGVPALLQLSAGLSENLQAAVLIVLHIGKHRSLLPQLIADQCRLSVVQAADGEPIERGCIYIAPPDNHLLVDGRRVRLSKGPKEHSSRPAIDPLFRTAALSWGPAVIGVVLTGLLDDGTPGLQAIKTRGGTTVVQDPADAVESSMPRSALRFVEVDHCVPLALMPALLSSLADRPVAAEPTARHDAFSIEQDIAYAKGPPMELLEQVAAPSTFVCPDCHGSLWKILDSRPERYRCHTGHGFTLRTLQHAMGSAGEEVGWSALRSLQERALILQHMARIEDTDGQDVEAARLKASADRIDRQVTVLRALLEEAPDPVE